MAEEHDLGTARGRIQIDSDVRTSAANEGLDAVAASASRLEESLSSASRKLAAIEAFLSKTAREAKQTARAMVELSASLATSAAAAATTAFAMLGLDKAMGGVGDSAKKVASAMASLMAIEGVSKAAGALTRQFLGFEGAINKTALMRGGIEKLGESILGIEKAVSGMGDGFSRSFRGIGALRGSIGAVNSIGQAFRIASVSTLALGAASRGLTRLPVIMKAAGISVAGLAVGMGGLSTKASTFLRLAGGVAAFAGLGGLANGLMGASRAMSSLTGSMARLSTWGNSFSGKSPLAAFGASLVRDSEKILKSVSGMMIGMAIFKRSMGTWDKYSPKIAIGVDGLTYGSLALKALSGAIMNVINALGQLSRAAAIIPGVVASLGAIGVVGKIAFKGMSDALKAGMADAADFSKKLKDVPEELKGVSRVIQRNKEDISSLKGVAITSVFGKTAEEDTRLFLRNYIPLLKVGFQQVGDGIHVAEQSMVRFMNSARGKSLVSSIFGSSGLTAANLGKSLEPAVDALLTIAKVGAEAFASLTAGAGSAAQRFREFVTEAQKTGRLRDWIDSGISGIRDLYQGTRDLAKGLSGVFSTLAGHQGTKTINVKTGKVVKPGESTEGVQTKEVTALERYAAAMQRFRENANAGSATTTIGQIAKMVNHLAEEGQVVLAAFGREIKGVIDAIRPFAESVSAAFAEKHVAEIHLLAVAVSTFFNVLNNIPGFATLIGYMLSFGVAFKILRFMIMPVIAIFGQLTGAFMTIRNFASLLVVFGAALRMAGNEAVGWRAKMALMGGSVVGSLGRVASFLTGPWGLALAAGGYAIYQMIDAQKKLNQAAKDHAKFVQFQARAQSDYGKALANSVGNVKDDSFTTATTKRIDKLRKGLETDRDNRPGRWAGINGNWYDVTERNKIAQERGLNAGRPIDWTPEQRKGVEDELSRRRQFTQDKNYGGKSYEYAKANDNANRAGEVLKVFDNLKISSEDASKAVTGSKAAYDNFIASIRNSKDVSSDQFNLIKEQLDAERKAFEEAQAAFNRQTPGLASLAQGLKLIGAAGDDAAEKLKGLKLALDGLFGTNNALDAAIATAEAIKKVGDATSELSLDQGKLAAGFNPATGGLDVANSEVQKLYQALKPIGDDLQNVAANGGNVAEALAKWQPQLDAIRAKSGASEDLWRKMLETARATPNEIVMVMKATGLNETDAWLAAIAIKSKQINGEPIRVAINGQEDIERLKALGATIDTIAGKPNEINVRLSPEALAKMPEEVRKVLASGVVIPAPTTPAKPGQPTQSPVVPAPGQATVAAPGAPATPTTPQGQVQVVQQAAEKIKPQYETMLVVKGSEDSVTVIQRVIDKLNEFVKGNWSVSVNIRSNQQNLVKLIGDLATVVRNAKVEIDLSGLDGLKAKLDEVRQKIIEFVDSMKPKIMEIPAAFTEMANAVNGVLDGMASTAKFRGEKLVDDFAAGIRSGADKVKGATMTVAIAATDPLPKSPAKVGPLSGKGYTDARGRKLSEDFAAGILAGQGSVANASLKIGGAAVPQSDIAVAVQAILNGGGANMEALRKYGLGPTSEETLAISDAGKKGVTATELETFLKSGDFQASGLAGKLDPSSETVNNLRKLRDNDKLVSDLVMKNHGVLLDPKEEAEKQFKAGRNSVDKVMGPFKRAVSGFSDILRGFMGQPLAGLSGQKDGQSKYMVDTEVSDYEVARNLAKRQAANIAQNNQSGTAVATASGSLSDANTALAKNASDIAEAQVKIDSFKPTGDAEKDKKSLEDLNDSLKKLKDETTNLTKAQVAAQNGLNTAVQTFQQQGGQTSQIPQLNEAAKKEKDNLDALTKAQKERADFKATGDEAKDSETRRTLDKAVADANTAYTNSKAATAQVAALMKTTVAPTLTGPGSPTAGTPFSGQAGSVSDQEIAHAGGSTIGLSILKAVRGQFGNAALENALKTNHINDGALHPQGKAVDIGAAGNNSAQIDQYAKWLFDNRKALGLSQIIYRSPNVGDQYSYYNRNGVERTGNDAASGIYGESTMQGHTTHIHAGAETEINFGSVQLPNAKVTAPGAAVATPGATVTQPAATQPPQPGGPRPISEFWDKIAAKESGGNWSNADTGGNGHYGGLQFSPSTWAAFGGKEFADMPHLATREQQIAVANRTAFTGYNGQKPQGLGAWEVITNGSTAADGITVNSKPVLDQIATNTGVSAGATAPAQNTLESLLAGNSNLAALMAKAADPNTSRQDTAKLLQQIDDYTAANPNDKELVDARKSQIMGDKGIKDDPGGLDLGPVDKALEIEGKVQGLVDGVLKVVKWPMDVYNSVQNMFDQGGKAFEMLIRGFSGTKDVNDFIDQMQATWGSVLNVFQTVTGIVGSVSDVFSTVADLAKTITDIVKSGAEVAGAIAEVAQVVGSIASVVSGVVGGVAAAVGSVDEMIDMAQEAWKIGSRYLGKALSWIAGGLGGPMQGTVRALYDSNDQSLKFWNAENPDMKTTYGLDPSRNNDPAGTNKPLDDQIKNQQQINIYANPNASASEIMQEQQYAVRTAGLGSNQNF